jgi:hypothetical protein
MTAKSVASRYGLGRLAYRLWYRPIGELRQSIREGGPLQQARDKAGHKAMRAAASELPTLVEPPPGPRAEIAFLSGPRYWHQTVFCFASLQLHTPFRVTPVIYDDGHMDELSRSAIRRVIPWVRFVSATESEERLDDILPASRFPALRGRRSIYPHLRKLTDIHVGSSEFRLVADSDMLFFRRAAELEAWFRNPQWLYMPDVKTSYGYPREFLEELAGAPMPDRVNVGLYAIDGASVDWECVEYWCATQLLNHGPHYVQEQALTAMLFADRAAVVLARERYVVMPDATEGTRRLAVLHHYVDVSKRAYFRDNWRHVSRRLQGR